VTVCKAGTVCQSGLEGKAEGCGGSWFLMRWKKSSFMRFHVMFI